MWGIQIFLALLGLSAGFAVAGGLFALIIGLGVVSRFAGKTRTAHHIVLYENCVAWGGIIGNILFVYRFPGPELWIVLPIFGLFAGVFVGSWYMALAEMVNTFPIFFRRIKFLRGMGIVILSLSIGKCVGSMIYFFHGW